MQSWILTFNRPVALNRQIAALAPWTDVNIFTNHPNIQFTPEHMELYQAGKIKVLHNTLSDPEACSYCARSWNNIFLKAFKTENEIICIQDDTLIIDPTRFQNLILAARPEFDFIWGPAGDQFFYLKKRVLKAAGWFDERYLGCYCGDADWLKRIWNTYDHTRISIVEKHDWGFTHNSLGVEGIIPTDIGAKAVDPTYINQHQEIEQKVGAQTNTILEHSQRFWQSKWGHVLNSGKPMIEFTEPSRIPEIDWYPWFTKKYLGEE